MVSFLFPYSIFMQIKMNSADMLLLTLCFVSQNFEAQIFVLFLGLFATPVSGNFTKRGLKMPNASTVKLRKSIAEDVICINDLRSSKLWFWNFFLRLCGIHKERRGTKCCCLE